MMMMKAIWRKKEEKKNKKRCWYRTMSLTTLNNKFRIESTMTTMTKL